MRYYSYNGVVRLHARNHRGPIQRASYNQLIQRKHMKKWWVIWLLLAGCQIDEMPFQSNPEGLVGTWKLVARASSSGGMPVESRVHDGLQISFLSNHTFVVQPAEECGSGFFYYDEGELVLDLFCNGAEEKTQTLVYQVDFIDDKMRLYPMEPRCIEGCWYDYKKLKD